MKIGEARGHEGETLLYAGLDNPSGHAELVRAGQYALHVRFAGSPDILTMHPRFFALKADHSRAVIGTPVPGRPGYVVGTCGDPVPEDEWDAGHRKCEGC
jgi:hypothetical protein